MSAAILYIHLFGRIYLLVDSEPWAFAARPKTLPLWAYLLLNRDQPIPRDSLAFLFWPDQIESDARSDLRRHLYDLERALPPPPPDQPWILRQGETLQWNPEASYWLDVAEFERLSASPRHLARAVGLYAGDLLPQVYDDWLARERERLGHMYLIALRQLMAQRSAEGDSARAISYAQQALNHDPLLEDIVRELMRLHYESGRRTEALQAYQALKRQLDSEWGVAPAEETQALFEAISRAAPAPAILAPAPFSPVPAREPPRHNLPAPLTSFIEREVEIAAIHRMLLGVTSPVRLLTLVGPPGTGKTRLALEATRRLLERQASHFPDGMFLVDLSAVAEPERVLPAIAATLDLKPEGDQSFADVLKAHLRQAYVLLILDNFEQVLDAGPDISRLLAAAPQLQVIITSRAALKLYGEHEFPVSSLTLPDRGQLPDAGTLREYGAIALFEARASQRQPSFALDDKNGTDVTEICLQLDGLPLAIELAAGQIQTLSPASMVQQMSNRLSLLTSDLRDVPEKHMTLRSAIAWSYDLLADQEKRLFRQLSVFAGGWTLEAAGTVCDPIADGQMADGLKLLEQRNLIQRADHEGHARWRMLATVREFGLERLGEASEARLIKHRHLQYFIETAKHVVEGWQDESDKSKRVQILTGEEDNLQAALRWALVETSSQADADSREVVILGTRLVVILYDPWVFQGRLHEGIRWNRQALAYRDRIPLEIQMSLLGSLGSFVAESGDYESARQYNQDSIEIAEQIGDRLHVSKMLNNLAIIAAVEEKYEDARQLFEQAIATGREVDGYVGSRSYYYPLSNLGLVYTFLGLNDQAQAIFEESLAWSRTQSDPLMVAIDLEHLANLSWKQKQYGKAQMYYHEAIEIAYKIDDKPIGYAFLQGLAAMLFEQGRTERACRLMGAAKTRLEEMGYALEPPDAEQLERDLQAARKRLTAKQVDALFAEGVAMTWDEAVAYALQA